MTDNNQRAFIKCTVCEVPELAVHFSSVTQFCDHLRKDHADKDIKPYHCSQCDYKCEYKQIGSINIGIISLCIGIPQ